MPQNLADQFIGAAPPSTPSTSGNLADQFIGTPKLDKPPSSSNLADKIIFGGGSSSPSGNAPALPSEDDRLGENEPWWNRPIQTHLKWDGKPIGEYREGASPIEKGIEKVASGLLTPLNLGLMIATGGLGGLAEAGAAEVGELGASSIGRGLMYRTGEGILSKLAPETAQTVAKSAGVLAKMANIGFTAGQIKGAAEAVPRIQDAIRAGDTDTAIEMTTEAVLGGAMAGLSGYHLAREARGRLTAPAWTKDKEAIAAYQQPTRSYGVRAFNFEKANKELIRNKPMDMAAYLYHESGGDNNTLELWRKSIAENKDLKPDIRQKWDGLLQQAQTLPENVKELSRSLRPVYSDLWAKGKEYGKYHPDATEPVNYAGQHEYVPGDEGRTDVKYVGPRQPTKSPGFTKERTFPSIIDALNAGWEQKEGLASAHSNYLRRFGEMKGLYDADAKLRALRGDDGRALAVNPAQVRIVDGHKVVPLPTNFDVNAGDVRSSGGWTTPLEARPLTARGSQDLVTGVEDYLRDRGVTPAVERRIVNVDTRAKEIADAYSAMRHNPADPKVQASYDALKKDIKDQWDYATKKLGVNLEPSAQDPYANSSEMMTDVRDNNRLRFFSTPQTTLPADHPMAAVDPQTGLSYNDMFRAVHDLFGHATEGHEFGPKGEENAWNTHRRMFSKAAIPALTTETKGQNSWNNFGPQMRDADGNLLKPGDPGYLKPQDRQFAPQKAGILPQRFWIRPDDDPEVVARRNVPTPEQIIQKDGTTRNLREANWITEDGDLIPRTADHGVQLGGDNSVRTTPGGGLAPSLVDLFITHGKAIRVMNYRGARGTEYSFTIPKEGVTRSQLEHLRNVSDVIPNGNVTIETARGIGDTSRPAIENISNPTPAKVEGAVRRMVNIRGPAVPEPAKITEPRNILGHIKSGGDFAVLQAENPHNQRISDNENKARTNQLLADLRKEGYHPTPVEGNTKDVEGQTEHAFFVPDISAKNASEFGRKYGQAGILTHEGLHWFGDVPEQDYVNPTDTKNVLTGKAARDQQYFTVLKGADGKSQAFSLPVDFNRQIRPFSGQEIPDAVASRPRTPAGSTVGLLEKPLPIEERPTVAKVADALQKFTLGKKLNALDLASSEPEQMLGRARAIGAHELYRQLGQENSGKGWYSADVNRFHQAMAQIHPELADDPIEQKWFNALTAAASLGNDSPSTIKNADEIYTEWKNTGQVPATRADGRDWGGEHSNANRSVLENLQKIVDHNGGDYRKATEWLLAKHPVSELNEVRARATKLPGKATDMQYGSRALSAKAGPFHLNLSGIPDEFTMDKWATRTWNRWMGTLVNKDGSVNEYPTPAQRKIAKQAFEELGKKFGLETREAQAVMWFYEQELYATHGVNIDKGVSYGDAAEDYVRGGRNVQPGENAGYSETVAGGGENAFPERLRAAGGQGAGEVQTDTSFNPDELSRIGSPANRAASGTFSALSNPAETGGLSVVDLNDSGRKLVSAMMETDAGWTGKNIGSDKVRRAIATEENVLANMRPGNSMIPRIRQLLDNLKAAVEHNGNAGVMLRLAGLPPEEAQSALDHELWHAGQRSAGGGRFTVHTDEVLARLHDHPLEQKASQTLQDRGYPDQDLTTALEVEAHVLTGDYLGLSPEEARQLLFDHYEALKAANPNGIPTPNEHAQRYAKALQGVAEAHAEHTQRLSEGQLPGSQAPRPVGQFSPSGQPELVARGSEAPDRGVNPGRPVRSEPEAVAQRPTARVQDVPRPAEDNPRILSKDGKLYYDVSDYKEGPDVFSRYRVKAIDKDGNPVFEKGNLLIHPNYLEPVNKAFADSSWFRKTPILNTVLKLSTQAKKSLLSFSPFHWNTEYLRGIQMGLSPLEALHPKELTPDRLAVTSKFGPQTIDTRSRSLYSEGAAQHSELVNKIPFFGKVLSAAEDKLFGDYIPRLKADAFDKVVAQLSKRHGNWSEDQVHFAAGKMVDAAFGGLNWKMLGMSMNSQDALRLVMLAPDFTGSQLLFAKYGADPGGSVVNQSFARIALYNFAVARVLNMLTNGKMHAEHPFGVVSPDDKKVWSIRTMPEDIFHALSDPRGFFYNRLNPLTVRTAWEALSGRDARGKAVSTEQELGDLLRNVSPIPAQNLYGPVYRALPKGAQDALPSPSGNPDDTVLSGGLKALGLGNQPNTTTAQRNAAKLASNHAESGPVDQAQLEHHQRVIQYEDAIRSGKVPMSSLSEAVMAGQIAVKDAKAIQKNVAETKGMDSETAKLYTRSARLPMPEFLSQVWSVATPPEKTTLTPLLLKKRQAYLKAAMTGMTPQQRMQDPTIRTLLRMFPTEAAF